MARRNSGKKRAAMGVVTRPCEVILASRDSSAKKLEEPRANDAGFSIEPQPSTRPTIVRFYCQHPDCPGFAYAASERAHPYSTCGAEFNMRDLPNTTAESENEIMESPALIDPKTSDRNSDFATVVKLPESKERPLTEYLDHLWTTADGSGYLELARIGAHQIVEVVTYEQRDYNEVLTPEWRVSTIPESEFRASLRDLVEANDLPVWLVLLRGNCKDAFREGISKLMLEQEAVDAVVNAAAEFARPDPFIEETRSWCKRIADELGVDALDVQRLMGTVFQTIEQLVTLKEITSSSAALAALFEKFKAPVARSYLFQLADGVVKGPIRDTIIQATEEQINRFDVKIADAAGRLDELKAHIESTIGDLDELPASDADGAPLAVQVKDIKTEVAKLLEAYEGKLESLLEKFEAVNADLSKVERRMDDVERGGLAQELNRKHLPGHRNTKTDQRISRENTERRKRAKRLMDELGPDDLEDEDLEDEDLEDEDLEDEDIEDDDLEDDDLEETGFKDPRRALRDKAQTAPPPAKRGPGRPKGSKKAIRKKATPKTLLKPGRKPGRPRKVAEKQPLSNPKPGLIDAFMGKQADPSIRNLLKRIAPVKTAKFISQAQKGMPQMDLTPWTSAERVKFAQWFYGRRRG